MSNTPVPGLPVAGYAPTQTQASIDLVNEGKILEERVLRYMEKIATARQGQHDARFLAAGKTDIQKGFMLVYRAVFQPDPTQHRVEIPGDPVAPAETFNVALAKSLDALTKAMEAQTKAAKEQTDAQAKAMQTLVTNSEKALNRGLNQTTELTATIAGLADRLINVTDRLELVTAEPEPEPVNNPDEPEVPEDEPTE